jgi:ubiquitin C-terminal hydrolase
VIYDLYGVINHHGSLYGGHYTAYCLNFLDRRWYEFNDSRVSQIAKGEVVSDYSYVLFYKRREK